MPHPSHSRKTYQLFASIIRKQMETVGVQTDPYAEGVRAACEGMVHDVVPYFQKDNPRFNEQRFRRACFGGRPKS